MPQKELTHIYTLHRSIGSVNIGSSSRIQATPLELFAKTLPLTSDLKRLPYLLGFNMHVWLSPDISGEVGAGAVENIAFSGILLNGTYTATFSRAQDVLDDPRASDDIIGMCSGIVLTTGLIGADQPKSIDIQNFAWDFEGRKILYDTVTLLTFAETEVNVGDSAIAEDMIDIIVHMEVDWRPVSLKEIQEFIMEHIYAKQGD